MVSALTSCLTLISSAPLVAGHGYMTIPEVRARNYGKFRYEPQSLGAVGPGGPITICGRGGASNFNEADSVTKLPAPGSKFTIQAKITAHHLGHMIVRVCPFLNSDIKHEDLKDRCVRLIGTESGKDVWPLSAATGVKEWEVTLPSKQELTKVGTNLHNGVYTIQWRYNTANSCKPPEDVENPGSICNEWKCCSEVFTNCADVVFDGVPFDAPKEVENPHKPEPIPSPSPGGGADAGAGGGCLREDDLKKNPWAKDKKLIIWCANLKSAEECSNAQQCRWTGAGAGPEPEAEPESAHEMSPTEEAQKEGLKGVQQFCDRNKAYFCDQKNPAVIGNEICECSPAEPEPESEPEAKPEPKSKPEPKPKPEPKSKPGPKSQGSAPTDPSECGVFKKWCQEDACNYKVKTNQCWGSDPTTFCRCSDDPETERAGDWPGLLQMTQTGESRTKFSGKVTRQIGAHGEITP